MAQKVDYAALKKGGYMRQKQKGYGSLRLAVVGGNLTAENIKTVAEVAEKYGRGYVHMTSRQGIEIPFIKVEELAEVKEALAKGGVGTGVCGPRVRTVTACQGSEAVSYTHLDVYKRQTIYRLKKTQNYISPVAKDSIEMQTAELLAGPDGAFEMCIRDRTAILPHFPKGHTEGKP